MSDTLSFAELDAQHVELLPARTVLSVLSMGESNIGNGNTGGSGGTNLGIQAQVLTFKSGQFMSQSANGGPGCGGVLFFCK